VVSADSRQRKTPLKTYAYKGVLDGLVTNKKGNKNGNKYGFFTPQIRGVVTNMLPFSFYTCVTN
jgi:hypothetical protein